MNAVSLGLVGAGRWGRNYIGTINGLSDVTLRVVASRNPQTAALVPPGCRVVERWQDVVGSADVDGIVVAAPPSAHADIVVAAIEVGKAVMVEKPLAQDLADAQRIRRALDLRPVPLLIDHIHLFNPSFRRLCQEATVVGPVRSIASSAGNHGPYRSEVPVLWDWGPHDLAMCLTLVPGTAHAVKAARLGARRIDGVIAERLSLDIALETGIAAHIRLSTLDDRHRWFAAAFDSCTLVYRDAGAGELVRLPRGADIERHSGEVIATSHKRALSCAVEEFAISIRTHNHDCAMFELGSTVVDLLAEFDAMLKATAAS